MGCRGCLILLVIALLVVVALVGGTYYLITQPSSLVAGETVITPSKDVGLIFDHKVKQFTTDLKTGLSEDDSPTAALEVTEEEATLKLAEFIANGQFPLDLVNPHVHFHNQRILLSADIAASGLMVNLVVQARVDVREGKPDIVAERIDLGRMTLPNLVREQLLDAIAAGGDPAKLQSLPFDIDSLGIEDGILTIRGIKGP